jgi:hypothetical protein
MIKNVVLNGVPLIHAEFGNGDIKVASGMAGEASMVTFRNIEAVPVGTKIKDGITRIEDEKPELIFTFTDSKSIDVVMFFLRRAKKNLIIKQGK